MTRSSHRILGATLVSAALLLASCSSSGGDDAKDTTTTEEKTTTTAAEETTTTAAEEGGDPDAQARAESVDLTVSDFPDGWDSAPGDDSSDPSPLDQCDPSFADDSDELATFRTGDFTLGDLNTGDGTNVAVETKVFTDEDAAVAALAPFSDPEVLTCVDEKLKEQFGSGGATVEGEFVEDDSYPITTADEVAGASGEYTVVGTDGTETPLVVAVLLIRTGDLASQVLILSVGDSLDPTTLQAPIAKVEELQADA